MFYIFINLPGSHPFANALSLLSLGCLHGSKGTMTASGLSVLTTHTNAPVVTKTPVKAHALHTLNVLERAERPFFVLQVLPQMKPF